VSRPRHVELVLESGTILRDPATFSTDHETIAHAEALDRRHTRLHLARLQGVTVPGPIVMTIRAHVRAYPYVRAWCPYGGAVLLHHRIPVPPDLDPSLVHDYRTSQGRAIRARAGR
jgi:hypothetical protein